VHLGKHYPYVVPIVKLRKVEGLTAQEQSKLMEQLVARASDLAQTGSVMMVEMVQVAEDFLAEHNRDPNMSAWEQMKAREALEKQDERRAQDELDQLMNTGITKWGGPLSPTTSSQGLAANDKDISEDQPVGPASTVIERELMRQRQALDAARRVRSGQAEALSVEDEEIVDLGDDMDDFDDLMEEEPHFVSPSTSRYLSDFVELGVLGRGGGGEVVKVRNRLDRRVYAIKKIVLQSEKGRLANYTALQNRKLRREVTTISRMTHKNIVRYYQAWVEGADEAVEESEKLVEEVAEQLGTFEESDGDDSSTSSGGWWEKSPAERHLDPSVESRRNMKSSSSEEKNHSSIERLEGEALRKEDFTSSSFLSESQDSEMHSNSKVNLLTTENDYDFQSPLLTGFGFQDNVYDRELGPKDVKRAVQHSEDSNSDSWGESSKKVDGEGGAVLYIQMEYCSTTLRELIDEGHMMKMEENERWRLIRQVLEALVYIHSRKIVSGMTPYVLCITGKTYNADSASRSTEISNPGTSLLTKKEISGWVISDWLRRTEQKPRSTKRKVDLRLTACATQWRISVM
jgi:eukaryotic translation initiation factor 2-alpha kinase 4